MKFVHLIALLAIAQFIVFTALVGRAREKYGVKAPAVSGNEHFERAYRVQMNTLEQLICFLPALFLAAVYWPPLFISLLGLVFLVGRIVFRQAYVNDPAKRAIGFMLSIIPTLLLILAAIIGVLFRSPIN